MDATELPVVVDELDNVPDGKVGVIVSKLTGARDRNDVAYLEAQTLLRSVQDICKNRSAEDVLWVCGEMLTQCMYKTKLTPEGVVALISSQIHHNEYVNKWHKVRSKT